MQKAGLHSLACWTYCELPIAILARAPPHLTQPELSKLMTFKLSIGKWRPGLQKYVDELSPEEVKAASLRAFAFAGAGKVKESIEALTVLKGVGPATATLILSAYSPQFPFMSDEALEEVVGSRQYTLGEALALTEACRAKAQQLNTLEHAGGMKAAGTSGSTGQPLQPRVTPQEVQAGRTIDTATVRPAAAGTAGADVTAPAHAHMGTWTANRVQMAVVGAVRAAKGATAAAGSSGSTASSPCASCCSPSSAGLNSSGMGTGMGGTGGAVPGGTMPAHAGCLALPCGAASGTSAGPAQAKAGGGKRKGPTATATSGSEAAREEMVDGAPMASPTKKGKGQQTGLPAGGRGARTAK